MEGKWPMEFTDILNPIQFKQATNYFISHPYDYV